MQSSREQILQYLRDAGEGTVEAIAETMRLAPVTVRHHLNVLRDRGLIEVDAERVGRGRPRLIFRLSPKGGAQLCEDRYAALSCQILETLKAQDASALQHFFESMAKDVVAEHREALDPSQGLDAKLDLAIELLNAQGFAARLEKRGDDYLAHIVGCPYEDLSLAHSEVCCMDQMLIEDLLGQPIQREEWRRQGDAACVYKIPLAAQRSEEELAVTRG